MIIIGFLLGFSVPFVARRIIKVFPEEVGATVAYLLVPRSIRVFRDSAHSVRCRRLYMRFFLLSVAYGLFGAGVLLFLVSGFEDGIVWMAVFMWLLLVLMEVDRRSLLLPDVLTVPLLLFGVGYAAFTADLSPMESAAGALFGYFVPAAASALVYFFKRDTIGGGDVKMLAAVGAWLGIYYLVFAIAASFLIFTVFAVIGRNRTGPYGPSIALATLLAMYVKHYGLLDFI